MIVTAESSFFSGVANLDHEVYQVLDREDPIAKDWILGVNGLYEGPELVDQLSVVCVHPEVSREHQMEEKLFTEPGVIN